MQERSASNIPLCPSHVQVDHTVEGLQIQKPKEYYADQLVILVNESNQHVVVQLYSQEKTELKHIHKPYNIEAPSTEDNHTVKSAPQAVVLTSDTRQRTGDDSISTKKQSKRMNQRVDILYWTCPETYNKHYIQLTTFNKNMQLVLTTFLFKACLENETIQSKSRKVTNITPFIENIEMIFKCKHPIQSIKPLKFHST